MKAHGIPLDGLVSNKTRVLIVDPEPEVAQTLQRLLTEHAQNEVHTATTSCAAGFECERLRPNIILTDVDHERLDGRGLAKLVRSQDDLQITKLVAMSSKLTDGQAHQLHTAGFDSFLKKPFNLRQVIAVIEEVLALVY
jgi:DNA-binding response OmpR family regulator